MLEAGIEDLRMFKHFNIIDSLCNSVLDYDNFMKVKTDYVYMKLLRNQVKARIEEELGRIKRRKAGQ